MIQDDYLRLQKNLPTTPPPPKGFVDLRYSQDLASVVSVNEEGAESALGGGSGSSAAKVVANAAARLALSLEAAKGFAVVDADTGKTWMLVANGNPATSGDWLQLGDRDIQWGDVGGKPSTFPPDVTAIADGALSIAKTSGLQTALDGKLANTNAAVAAAIAENPAAVLEAIGQKQTVINVAVFGDSRASQSSSSQYLVLGNGVLHWFQMATGWRLSPVLNSVTGRWSFSQGSQTFGTLNNDAGSYPRVAELIAAAPAGTVVLMYCGINGMSNPATEYADFVTVTERFVAAGLYPVAYLEPYLGASDPGTTYVANRDTYNANVIAYCNANGIPFIDGMELFNSGITTTSLDYMFYNDGGYLHPNTRGSAEVGIAFARCVEAAFELPAFPVNYRLVKGSPSKGVAWASGATGNGSTTGFDAAATNCTMGESYVRRTDGQPGYWLRLAITDCGEGAESAGTGAGSVQVYNSLSTGAANMPAAGNYRGVVEIEVDEWDGLTAASTYTNLRNLYLTAVCAGGASPATAYSGGVASAISYQAHTVGQRQSPNPTRNGKSTKIALMTPVFPIAADNTSVNLSLYVYGNGILRVGNLALIAVE